MAAFPAEQRTNPSHQLQTGLTEAKRGLCWSPFFAVIGAWVAAGSTGLLAHSLRQSLTLLALVLVAVTGWPATGWASRRLALAGFGIFITLAMLAAESPPINVLACAVVLLLIARMRAESNGSHLLRVAWSILVFALYRFALLAVPSFWLLVDGIAQGIAVVGGVIGFNPLSTGASFAGLDYLVLSAALLIGVLRGSPAPRRPAALKAVALILGVHLLYLVTIANYPRWIRWFIPTPAPTPEGGHPPPGLQDMLVWYLPALGLLAHACVAALLIHRSLSLPAPQQRPPASAHPILARWLAGSRHRSAALAALALAIPALALLNPVPLSLEGKKVVIHEKGFLNWLKPKHGEYGRLSVGMYGMLPRFFESYGARCVVSPDLPASDLSGAQLLILIFPNKTWEPGQLERIWRFVREGGSLLVLGEHTVHEKEGGGSRFNEVLEPTAMRVAFDSSMFAIGGWLQSYQALAHPAQLGRRDDRNQFGVVIGATVETRWPARPMLIGRWGWADPGDLKNDESRGGSMMGNQHYDAGERLGDLVLAAEQRLGRGRVVVFGDTSGFTNGILYGSHEYASALFASLGQGAGFGPVRACGTAAGLVLLLWLLWQRPAVRELILFALIFALSIAVSTAWSRQSATLFPDGRSRTPNTLAYLDAVHHSQVSGESWRINGIGGLELTLMRNDYQVHSLPDFSAERLSRAGLLISAAPGRTFTRRERRVLREFIENGGIFICTVGYPESAASREVLAELGFYIGGIGAATGSGPEPKPFGHFKAPYHNGGDYMAYVRFHAAWNVESSDPQAQPLAYGPRDPRNGANQPDPAVILLRRIGRGKAVVVADTQFVTNQNLENEGGQPFEGMRENADFWRWLLTYLNDQPLWIPPKPQLETNAVPLVPPDDPVKP